MVIISRYTHLHPSAAALGRVTRNGQANQQVCVGRAMTQLSVLLPAVTTPTDGFTLGFSERQVKNSLLDLTRDEDEPPGNAVKLPWTGVRGEGLS